eukprot:scaffold10.g2234.t1
MPCRAALPRAGSSDLRRAGSLELCRAGSLSGGCAGGELRRAGSGELLQRSASLARGRRQRQRLVRSAVEAAVSPFLQPDAATAGEPSVGAGGSHLGAVAEHVASGSVGDAAGAAAQHGGLLAHLHPHLPALDHAAAGYLACLTIGSLAVFPTIALTSRFVMSYFPGLERRAKLVGKPSLCRALMSLDPVLDPITKGWFKMTEHGDLSYGAFLMLVLSSAVLEALVGAGGLAVHSLPSLDVLVTLREVLAFQNGLILPCWAMVVFKHFSLI